MNLEDVWKVLVVLLLVVAVGFLYPLSQKDYVVNVAAPVVNVPSPAPVQFSTGAGGPVQSTTTQYFTSRGPVGVIQPSPTGTVKVNNQVRFALMNGSITELGQGIRAFAANSTPSFLSALTIDNFETGGRVFTAAEYSAANVSGAPTANFTSNISVAGSEVPRIWFKIKAPSRGINVTIFIGLNATNNSAPGLMLNVTTLVYNFTLGGFQLMNVSGTQAITSGVRGNMTLNASLQGNLSSQLIHPVTNEIYLVSFPGNATLAYTTNGTGALNVNGSNTTIQLAWVSAVFYANTSTQNYTLNVTQNAAFALNVTIYGRDDLGAYRSEVVVVGNAITPAGNQTLYNYTYIYAIVKNSTAGAAGQNTSVKDMNGNVLASFITSTAGPNYDTAYPLVMFNGSADNYPPNASIVTDALDVGGFDLNTVYLNFSDVATAFAAGGIGVYASPDNVTWFRVDGAPPGTYDAATSVFPLNNTVARFLRLNVTYLGAEANPPEVLAALVSK